MDMLALDFSSIDPRRKGRLMRPSGRKSAPKFAWVAVDTNGAVRIEQATVDQKTSAHPDGVFGGHGTHHDPAGRRREGHTRRHLASPAATRSRTADHGPLAANR